MESAKNSILSFVIPVYNAEAYLMKCLDSILTFSSEKIEVVLVDDGSTDGSVDLCDVYAEKDSRVKVIHKKNGGVASARNEGIKASSGTYLFFVDNDDWVNTEKLPNLLDILENRNIDILFNRYVIARSDGTYEYGNVSIDTTRINGKSTEEVLYYFKTKRINIMAPWEYIIKKEVITTNGLSFDIQQNGVDDSSFSPILFCHCNSFSIDDGVIYFWRQRQDSQGKNHDRHAYICKMIAAIHTLDAYRNQNTNDYAKEYMLFSIYKNVFSLIGQYYLYDAEDRLILNRWYSEQKSLVKKAAGQSGMLHQLVNRCLGGFYGIILSYRLAVLKGFIHSNIYGHRRGATK